MKILLNIIAWFWIGSAMCLAQNSGVQYKFDKLTFKDGLSQNTVMSVCQDQKGFLWFGTQDGLNRYDGYSFITYKNEQGDTTSIAGNFIRYVMEDKSGQLWVAANGLNLFDRKKETFKRFRHNPKVSNTLPSNIVFCIYQDKKENIWVGTNNGLSLVQKKPLGDYAFKNYQHDSKNPQSLADNTVYCIFEDNKGRLWVGTDGGLSCMDTRGGLFNNFRHDPQDSSSIIHKSVRGIWQDRSNALWIATPKGLSRMNTQTLSAGLFSNYHSRNTPELTNDNFYSVFADRDNSIWVGSAEGLFKINTVSEQAISVQKFVTNPLNKAEPYDNIRCMFEDKGGVLWFGTYTDGIRKLDKNKLKFQLYEHNPYLDNTLANSDISCMYEDGNTLWIGTNYGGLCKMINESGVMRFKTVPQVGNLAIKAITKDRNGQVWVGTNGNGLFVINSQSSSFQRYSFSGSGGIGSNTINAIFEDSRGTLWISTATGVDMRPQGSDRFVNFTAYGVNSNGFKGGEVIQFLEDTKGHVWLASSNGLYKYDRQTNRFTVFNHDPKNPESSIPSNDVRALGMDLWGNLWIGTQLGLCKLNAKKGIFTCYGLEENSLLREEIMGILGDEKGYIWISTGKGIIKFDVQSENYRLYDTSDGLQMGSFNVNSCHRGRSGRFYFGGTGGFNSFYPQQIKNNMVKVQPVVTALYIFNHFVNFKDRKDVLSESISESNLIELDYDDRAFSLDFSAMQFSDPDKNAFSYRLEGFEDAWVFTNAENRFASYENLPAGEYTFLLRASNSDGVWCEEATSIKIIIHAPFWRTWWFRLLMLVLLVAVLWGGLRLHGLSQTNQRLREDVEMKNHALNIEQRKLRTQVQNLEGDLFYAKHIQELIMPREEDIARFFDDCFVFYKPKSIVGGDFLWLNQQSDKVVVAVVDCSGSGIPGAFLSLIVNHHLHQIVTTREITEPALILKFLHRSLQAAMQRMPDHSFEGVEISLCTINTKKHLIQFAGAKHQLVYKADNQQLRIFRGNKQPVGGGRGWESKTSPDFEQQDFSYQAGAVFYMYTDGYADQFGGEKSKKIKLQPFRDLLNANTRQSMSEQKIHLERYLSQWIGNRGEQTDDVLVLGFRLM